MTPSLVLLVGMTAMAQVQQSATHRLLNVGVVETKFYVPIQFEDGYQTQVAVINGYLPFATIHKTRSGYVYRLDLNYSVDKATKYDPSVHVGVIKYTNPTTHTKPPTPVSPPDTQPLDPVSPNRVIPKRDDNHEIDHLLNSLRDRNLEKPEKTRFVRPSDIGAPPRAITPNYDRP